MPLLLSPETFQAGEFTAYVERILADDRHVIEVPARIFHQVIGEDKLVAWVHNTAVNVKPKMTGAVIEGLFGKGWMGLGTDLVRTAFHYKEAVGTVRAYRNAVVSRPVISFEDNQKAVLISLAGLVEASLFTVEQWRYLVAALAWNDRDCRLSFEPGYTLKPDDIQHFRMYIGTAFEPLDGIFAEAVGILSRRQQHMTHTPLQAPIPGGTAQPTVANAAPAPTRKGAAWLTPDMLRTSRILKTQRSPSSLFLGNLNGHPVYYDGHESLCTIGGAGSGKTQTNVIPNLLDCPGSMVVLDVKGDLWDLTAGYRQAHYGPVYRFAPTDPQGRSNRYNPFDFISTSPQQAANDCQIFSYEVIENNPNLKDPYWNNRARDFLWAFAMVVALRGKGGDRSVKGLSQLMSLPLIKDKDRKGDIYHIIDVIRELAQETNILDLTNAANALETGLNGKERLDSIIDAGRQFLNLFARSPSLVTALSTSDWRPEYLRTRPGTTLYICLSPAELKSYSPIIRTMLTQHSRTLQQQLAKPTDVPVTFMMDELPQLGNFTTILELQDVGRGAGLRLWMLAQTLGQFSRAFGQDLYQSVLDGCRVRTFLEPQKEETNYIMPILGDTVHPLTNKTQPLAEASDLMGRAYSTKAIVVTRGERPMALDKVYAHQAYTHKFMPPPVLKSRWIIPGAPGGKVVP